MNGPQLILTPGLEGLDPDALVLEEDTYLVLSADPRLRDPARHPIRLMTDLVDQQSLVPGEVLASGTRPLRLRAIVHDLDQEPSTCQEWIELALDRILALCQTHGIRVLATQALGAHHGAVRTPEAFLEQLETRIQGWQQPFPATIYVLFPSKSTISPSDVTSSSSSSQS